MAQKGKDQYMIGWITTLGLLVLTCVVLGHAGMQQSVTMVSAKLTDLCLSMLLAGMLLAMLLAMLVA
jgi:hypothetical protein